MHDCATVLGACVSDIYQTRCCCGTLAVDVCACTCRGVWRNSLMFGPTDKHSNFSFADVMTVPLAEALRDALNTTAAEGALYTPPERTRPVVYVGLQGTALWAAAQHP